MKRILIMAVIGIVFAGFAQTLAAKELVEGKPFVYNDAGKRDPFWPLVSETGAILRYDESALSASDMTLMGVLTGSDNKRVAVINGTIVKEGDMLGTFKVKRVASAFVVLDNGQEEIQLRLRKEE